MKRLIVIKGSSNLNPDSGIVIPVALESEDGSYHPVDLEDFPNQGIFISKHYTKIEEEFKEDEFFILQEWRETDSEEWRENKKHKKYYAIGEWTERPERNTLIPVIKMNMPDIATGYVDLGYDLPKNVSFFIEKDGSINGPFSATKDEEQWFLDPYKNATPLNLPTDYIAKIKKADLEARNQIITLKIHNTTKTFITSLKKINQSDLEKIDYISDSRLIKYYAKSGFGKGNAALAKNEVNKLILLVESLKKKNKIMSNDGRLKRLEGLLYELLDYDSYGKEIIKEFLNDTEGKKYLDSYFASNRDLLVKEKFSEIEAQTRKQREKAEKEINELNRTKNEKIKEIKSLDEMLAKERAEAEEKIKIIHEQTDEQAHQSLLQKQETLMKENGELEDELRLKKSQCAEFSERYEYLKKIKDFREEIKFLSRTLEEKREERIKTDRILEKQRSSISSPDLGEKLTELKTLIQMLNGKTDYSSTPELLSTSIKQASIELTKENKSDYINELIRVFQSDDGRPFSFDEMANLVICTSQSFLTILSGPPGTGKTSTAFRLAKAMNLTSQDNERLGNFLSIAVGRGWVAGRDIIGFYNSLKEVYQPSRSGLYQFLRNKEKSSELFTKLVLLDEANLSSIEHYWSDFLAMCDPDTATRKIYLGMPDTSYLEIGGSVRFIATINNDATTEKLSPRLIDRAPIISLAQDSDLPEIITANHSEFNGAVPYEQLCETFDISSGEAELKPDEQTALDDIRSILVTKSSKSIPIHVSKRKLNAIKRYCHTANELQEMQNRPLDYAIAQHILPLIEGHGSAFRDRLSKLDQKLTDFDLNHSRKLLRSMMEEGDNYAETYSYF